MGDSWRLAQQNNALWIRTRMIQRIRHFFFQRGYLEVETPHRIPAPAPEVHIDAVPCDGWFLHTSPEMFMKRLLAAGYEKIFQLARCFRNGERGKFHLPEFSILEWYRSGIDYLDLMDECEDLLISVNNDLGKGECIVYRGRKFDLKKPWERISVKDAFRRFSSLSAEKALETDQFDEIMTSEIEPNLGQEKPTFLYDYPAPLGSLARIKKGDPSVAERFELYIAGLELANAFSELTDEKEQRSRFAKEIEYRHLMGKTDYPLPERFLQALSTMPDSSGIALGVDRLAMIFADVSTIDEVVAFTPETL